MPSVSYCTLRLAYVAIECLSRPRVQKRLLIRSMPFRYLTLEPGALPRYKIESISEVMVRAKVAQRGGEVWTAQVFQHLDLRRVPTSCADLRVQFDTARNCTHCQRPTPVSWHIQIHARARPSVLLLSPIELTPGKLAFHVFITIIVLRLILKCLFITRPPSMMNNSA